MARELFSDVDMNHPWVEKYRLPVIDSTNPRYGYIVSVVVPREDDEYAKLFNLAAPTDAEAAVIGSYLEYKVETLGYRSGYLAKMRERALDVDDTINTITLVKRTDGSWAYSRITWTQPPAPFVNASYVPKSVIEILDYIEKDYMTKETKAEWIEWKRAHSLT